MALKILVEGRKARAVLQQHEPFTFHTSQLLILVRPCRLFNVRLTYCCAPKASCAQGRFLYAQLIDVRPMPAAHDAKIVEPGSTSVFVHSLLHVLFYHVNCEPDVLQHTLCLS